MGGDNLWRDRNKVFVAGIPPHADDDAFYDKFRAFGEMFQSKVVYDNKTGKSKGFGFITFSEYVNALEAVSQMNQTKWDNRVLNVRFLQPKTETGSASNEQTASATRRPAKVFGPCPTGCTTVYVGNLAYGISEPVLRKVFEACGGIKAVRFAEHIATKEFRGFGYVQFYDGGACENAVRLDGMIVMGRPMNIDYGSRDEATEKAREVLQRKLKKGVCHRFQSGECPRGDECKFAHVLSANDADVLLHSEPAHSTLTSSSVGSESNSSNNPDIPVCQSFLKGKCKRADKCKFLHVTTETLEPAASSHVRVENHVAEPTSENLATPLCQSFLKGKCKRGEKCKYRHDSTSAVGERAPSDFASTGVSTVASVKVPDPEPDIPVCLSYQKGTCKRDKSCRFRHVEATEVVASEFVAVSTVSNLAPETLGAPALDEDLPVCQNYLQGKCKRGAACRYRHVHAQQAPEVPTPAILPIISICKNFQRGRCARGTSCRFAHTDGNDGSAIVSALEADSIAVGPVTIAHSEYQKRFQSVCYNWQNTQSCARGDLCPFFHEGGVNAKPKPEQATASSLVADEKVIGSREEKEKKEKKMKKRHSDDTDDETEKKRKRCTDDGEKKRKKHRRRTEE